MITKPLQTDDLRIKQIEALIPPEDLISACPATVRAMQTVYEARQAVHRILCGADDRLLVVIGPCSIHDIKSAIEFAINLNAQTHKLSSELLLLMRVYFEKPRTTVGWKGFINDPYLNETFRIDDGLLLARKLLIDINGMGLPAAVEFLDTISPQYICDLVSWSAIGARTTESQVHREMASGLSCPVGFKNGTNGNVKIAVDAVTAARHQHHFLGVTKSGRSAIVATTGNSDCHIILRGGKQPNYDEGAVAAACEQLSAAGLPEKVMIDFSHSNSQKNPALQVSVCRDVAAQIARESNKIVGVMIESHLKSGRQDLIQVKDLVYGQSITDACIGWCDSVPLLDELAGAVRSRRRKGRAVTVTSDTVFPQNRCGVHLT